MQNKHILRLAPIFLLSLACQGMNRISDNALLIKSVHAPHQLGKIAMYHDENGFHVIKNNIVHDVKNHNLDSVLRNLKSEKLEKFQKIGYFSINESSDGEFSVKSHVRGKGGGPILAAWGVHIGVVGTNIIGHGALWAVASLSGPAAPLVYTGLAASYGPWIAATSKAVGIGVGIIGATTPAP